MTADKNRALPAHVRELAELAQELAPSKGFSPWLVLGIAFAESNFGRALTPPNPGGSGDFIPRPSNATRDALMKSTPLPGVVLKTLPRGIPARKLKGPVAAWVPTSHGWAVGVFQIDWESHAGFIKKGTWRDLRACMAYALDVLTNAREHLKEACALSGDELLEATVAAYNAGPGRVARFVREGKSFDGATFHPGYVEKIKRKADQLANASGAWRAAEGSNA